MNFDFTLVIICIGVIFVLSIVGQFVINSAMEGTKELGQAICSERFGMDYKSYDDLVLKCRPKQTRLELPYDGIVVKLENAK